MKALTFKKSIYFTDTISFLCIHVSMYTPLCICMTKIIYKISINLFSIIIKLKILNEKQDRSLTFKKMPSLTDLLSNNK